MQLLQNPVLQFLPVFFERGEGGFTDKKQGQDKPICAGSQRDNCILSQEVKNIQITLW